MSEARPSRARFVIAGALLVLVAAAAFYEFGVVGGGPREAPDAGAARSPHDQLALPSDDAGPAAATASVGGTVLDPHGHPAAGAIVWAADAQDHFHQAKTPSDGTFHFDLPPGEYRLAAQRGAETSDSEGPLPVGPGDDLRGLTLKLAPGARVAGGVFDLRSRAPLAGATVAIVATPLSAVTDERGHFSLPPLPAGGHQLSVQAEAHLSRVVPLAARSGEDTRSLEIYLTPSARVTGVVLTKDGTGVPAAALFVSRYKAAGEAPPLAPAGQSSDDGRFALDLAPGLVQLVARTPGFAEATTDMLDLAEGKPQDVKLTVTPGAQVDGKVTTASGEPLSLGKALAFRSPGGWQVGTADIARGVFTLTGLPAGHLVIAASAADAQATAEVNLEEAGEAPVSLRLGDRALEGVVVGGGKSQPVASARVTAHAVGAGPAGERSVVTNDQGHFQIAGLSGDRFDLSAEKDGSTAELRGVPSGGHDIQLVLASGGLSGTVTGPGGLTVTDFYVAAEPEMPGRGRPRAAQIVDGHGAFRIGLSPGRYRVRATAPGYAEGTAEGIEVASGAETSGVQVELRPAGRIEGVVVDDADGKPLPGIHIGTDRSHVWAIGRGSPLGGSSGLSGPDGHFTLRDVAPGSWPLYASASGFEQVGFPNVTVAAGENPAPVEVRMRRGEPAEKPYAGIGMSLWGRGDNRFAGEVFEGGPAHEAGVRDGDQILAVDGQRATGLNLQDLVARIRGPEGSEVSLDMRRGPNGQQYSVVVPRAEIRF